jgi:5-methylcytosine-specific restriction endonuclease McrA
MFEYCVREVHFSEDVAYKRIQVARAARLFPSIYDLLADGRLHLTAVVLLAPRLTPENAAELLAAAVHKSKAQIEQLLAERFPQPDLPTFIAPIAAAASPACQTANAAPANFGLVPEPVKLSDAKQSAAAPSACPAATARVAPLAPERYAVQCTVSRSTYEKLEHARELLGHAVPSGELEQVLDRALDALIAQLERQKFAKTGRPRASRYSDNARHIPAGVRRAVWERDGGRCTFVSENGRRCESRTRLEFDHVAPVATGGHATVNGLRLRCRTHNQLEAERKFGRDFMNARRERPAAP